MMMPLFGLGLAPLFVAGALRYLEWRYIFLVFVLPGLLLSFGMWKVIPPQTAVEARGRSRFGTDWRTALVLLECASGRLADAVLADHFDHHQRLHAELPGRPSSHPHARS
jgi:MFS family permease